MAVRSEVLAKLCLGTPSAGGGSLSSGARPGQARPGQARQARPAWPGQARHSQARPGQARRQARPGQAPGQARPGQAPGQARPGARPGQARPGQARPGQARPGQAGQARPGQARPGQARPGQARPGQARSGQVRSGQVRSGQASKRDVLGQCESTVPCRPAPKRRGRERGRDATIPSRLQWSSKSCQCRIAFDFGISMFVATWTVGKPLTRCIMCRWSFALEDVFRRGNKPWETRAWASLLRSDTLTVSFRPLPCSCHRPTACDKGEGALTVRLPSVQSCLRDLDECIGEFRPIPKTEGAIHGRYISVIHVQHTPPKDVGPIYWVISSPRRPLPAPRQD